MKKLTKKWSLDQDLAFKEAEAPLGGLVVVMVDSKEAVGEADTIPASSLAIGPVRVKLVAQTISGGVQTVSGAQQLVLGVSVHLNSTSSPEIGPVRMLLAPPTTSLEIQTVSGVPHLVKEVPAVVAIDLDAPQEAKIL